MFVVCTSKSGTFSPGPPVAAFSKRWYALAYARSKVKPGGPELDYHIYKLISNTAPPLGAFSEIATVFGR